jgi:EmrB/QacA subfamily drug resistance transporter
VASTILARPAATAFQDYCPQKRRRFVLIAAILASAMGFIDGSVVAIAIPSMRESLDASLTDAQWINNAYMLALSALILVGGAAGDKYGLKRVFSLGIFFFVIASIVCSFATGPQMLIVARAAQGVGAAIMVPGSLAIISKTYPKEDRARAIGIWAAASAMTTAIGPVLGGALLSIGNPEVWRLIFAINLPVGAIALYLLMARVPPDAPVSDVPLDRNGAVLATLALGLIAWALTGPQGEQGLPNVPHIASFGIPGLMALVLFLWFERRAQYPMMPLRLFAIREFSAANAVTFLLYFALSAVLFYLPMALITGWNLPEVQVGTVFLPITVAIAAGSNAFGKMVVRTGPAPLIGGGCALVALAYAALAFGFGWQLFWWHVFPSMCLMGLGMAMVVAPLSASVMGAASTGDSGAASGINNAISRIAGLVAVAAMGGVASAVYLGAGGTGGFGQPLEIALADHRVATDTAFEVIAWATAGLCAISSLIAFVFLPGKPIETA